MNISFPVFNMPQSLFKLSLLALMWEFVGLNPPNSSLYLAIYRQIQLPNLSNTQNQTSIQKSFEYIIINDIPYKESFDPAIILRCLDSQEADIVLHIVHNGISQNHSSGLILATNLE